MAEDITLARLLEMGEEMRRKVVESAPLEERLAGLAPEERVAGLAPEERVAGLAPEERVAGLTPEELRKLMKQIAQYLGEQPDSKEDSTT